MSFPALQSLPRFTSLKGADVEIAVDGAIVPLHVTNALRSDGRFTVRLEGLTPHRVSSLEPACVDFQGRHIPGTLRLQVQRGDLATAEFRGTISDLAFWC
jgi:hypothetical protein